jgi:hypothetical protein
MKRLENSWASFKSKDLLGDLIKAKDLIRNSHGFHQEVEDMRIAKFMEIWRAGNQCKHNNAD